MEFNINVRQIILGVIKPTGVITSVGIVTETVIKAIF